MSIRRVTAGLAALTLAATGILLAAPSASATGSHLVFICGDSSVRGNPGDTIVLRNDCGGLVVPSPAWTAGIIVQDWNAVATSIDPNDSVTLTLGTLGTGTIPFLVYGGRPNTTINVTVVDPAVEVVLPRVLMMHDEFQQVGVPASGSCADVPSTVGHYPGFPFGGWSQSWAQWINGGTGGPVCTRELFFDQSAGEWEILR